MLTGETITDDQIREQMSAAWDIYANACRALGFEPLSGTKCADPESVRAHRYRCAEIFNTNEER
jgi:hypothetical protein